MNPTQLAAASSAPAAPGASLPQVAIPTPIVPQAAVPHPGASPILQQAPVQLQAPMPLTWFQQHAGWLTHSVAALFIISAIALITLLAIQTTKQEGLSGSIGGRVESAYRGRLGAEEQIKRITGAAAVAFVITAFILSLTGI